MTTRPAPHTLTDEVHPDRPELRRIRAGRDIPHCNIRAGTVGGWVRDPTAVRSNAWVFDDAILSKDAQLWGRSYLSGDAEATDEVALRDESYACEYALVSGNAILGGYARAGGTSRVSGEAYLHEYASTDEDAEVGGNARLKGGIQLGRGARVTHTQHVMEVGPIGSESVGATLVRTRDGGHTLAVGCWTGTVDTLMAEVKRRSERWAPAYKRYGIAECTALDALVRARIALWDSGALDNRLCLWP